GPPHPDAPRRVRPPRARSPGHPPARTGPRTRRLGPHAALARRRGARRGHGRRAARRGGRAAQPGATRRAGRRGGRLAAALPTLPRHPGVARRRPRGAGPRPAPPRTLRRLARHGYVVFHDVGIPGTPANADHVVIGPAGVVLVDSKRYTGRVWQTPDGRVWHNQYPMDRPLHALRLEAAAISRALRVPVRPLVCVHGARVDFAGLAAGEVEIVPAGRLRTILTSPGPQHSRADMAALAAHAHTM